MTNCEDKNNAHGLRVDRSWIRESPAFNYSNETVPIFAISHVCGNPVNLHKFAEILYIYRNPLNLQKSCKFTEPVNTFRKRETWFKLDSNLVSHKEAAAKPPPLCGLRPKAAYQVWVKFESSFSISISFHRFCKCTGFLYIYWIYVNLQDIGKFV